MKLKFNKTILLLLGILSLGLLLRIYGLNKESFWLDECISVRVASLKNVFLVILIRYKSFHPPFYYLLLRNWINIFGSSEFSARFLSVILGFFAIIMTYKVGSYLFDKETGIFASLILALSRFHVYYSQEARMYSLMPLFGLISMYFFVKLLSEDKYGKSYIVTNTLLIYTHHSGLLIILVQNIYFLTVLFFGKKKTLKINLKRWVLSQAVIAILCIPLVRYWIVFLLNIQGNPFWIPQPSATSLMKTFTDYSGSFPVLLLFLLLIGFSLITYKNTKPKMNLSGGSRYYLLLLWLSVPIVVPFAISQVSAPLYTSKYIMTASLAFYILAAKGISIIKNNKLKYAVVSIIVIFSLVSIVKQYKRIDKPQWREVSNYITENAKPDDLLMFNDPASKKEIFNDYYFKRTDVEEKIFPGKINAPYMLPTYENVEKLFESVKGHDRVWIILSHTLDGDKVIKKTFKESYNIVYYGRYNSIELFLFEKK
ncbi:MAG: glycosyltransferase family 39 protein [Candidatus Omnitrophica bacterium]|nr:glycosyltransferase family 39 protein [Candidatus Omnitrophota bacterium]